MFAILAAMLWAKHHSRTSARLLAGNREQDRPEEERRRAWRGGNERPRDMIAGAPRERFDAARRLAWLRLWRSENIGPRTFQVAADALRLGRGGARRAARSRSSRSAVPAGRSALRRLAEIEAEMAVAQKSSARASCVATRPATRRCCARSTARQR